MFCGLAERFSFGDKFRRSADDWLRDISAPVAEMGGDLETLKQGPFRLDVPMVPYADRTFPTLSGKFQFMTEFDPSLMPERDPEFPYTLLTIAPHGDICSERTLAEHDPLPVVTLNTAEAVRLGLSDGEFVLVASTVGRLKALLKPDDHIRPDVLITERGGWHKAGHGMNILTKDMSSKVGRGTPFYETRVSVSPWLAGGGKLAGVGGI